MKITSVETFPLSGKTDPSAYGFIVKVTASDGTFGFGEADTLPGAAAAIIAAPVYHDSMGGLAAALIGQDAEDVEALWDRMSAATLSFGRDGVARHAMAALDIALWDLKGKLLGKPVHELLGGCRHARLRTYAVHGLGATLAETESIARQIVDAGFTAVKFGWPPLGPDPDVDEAIVRTIRSAVGAKTDILIDGGMAWNVDEALDRCRRFASYDLYWLEEPLIAYDITGYGRLKSQTQMPIAAGEMAASGDELTRLIEAKGVDFVQIDISRTGLTVARQVAAVAARHGIRVVNHTYSHILNTAASLHFMASSESIGLFECQFARQELRDALAGGQLKPDKGWLEVPMTPGLGVSVSEAALASYRID